MVEPSRGCGFRKGGGLYLMSDGIGVSCGALPIPVETCPCCGAGIKPARGWTWIEPDRMLAEHIGPHDGAEHDARCPLGAPGRLGERCGLLWIGEAHYKTPDEWIAEGRKMGFSRRIRSVPKGFVAGETWVLAGHRKAILRGYTDGEREIPSLTDAHREGIDPDSLELVYTPGIFHVWQPSRIEYVVKGDETEEELAAIEARGIEPVKVIPEGQTEIVKSYVLRVPMHSRSADDSYINQVVELVRDYAYPTIWGYQGHGPAKPPTLEVELTVEEGERSTEEYLEDLRGNLLYAGLGPHDYELTEVGSGS